MEGEREKERKRETEREGEGERDKQTEREGGNDLSAYYASALKSVSRARCRFRRHLKMVFI